jgi:hypothetical protein
VAIATAVVTTFIELPASLDPTDIEVASLWLEGAIPVAIPPTPKPGDGDENGTPALMAKFSRQALIALLCETARNEGTVELRVTGNVAGDPFEVRGTVRVQGQCPYRTRKFMRGDADDGAADDGADMEQIKILDACYG